jgi:hypothetical protein
MCHSILFFMRLRTKWNIAQKSIHIIIITFSKLKTWFRSSTLQNSVRNLNSVPMESAETPLQLHFNPTSTPLQLHSNSTPTLTPTPTPLQLNSNSTPWSGNGVTNFELLSDYFKIRKVFTWRIDFIKGFFKTQFNLKAIKIVIKWRIDKTIYFIS